MYRSFCERFQLRVPILLAPMAGSCPPSLSIAVGNAGGMAACGALTMQPQEIAAWVAAVRAQTAAPVHLNLWVPDPPPRRDAALEARWRELLGHWGPAVADNAGDAPLIDFDAQCEAILAARPSVASSIMGLFPPAYVERLKAAGISWFATATTVAEAKAAQAAGADAIIAQGAEAGGHRGAFDAALAERQQVGLFALLPAIVDAVTVPVVATGGIGDARGVAAALTLGASAVQIGTGFLRAPEAKLAPAWADKLAETAPEDTMVTRAFSGRAGRGIATDYALAAMALPAAAYPVQRGLTAAMRKAALESGNLHAMQAWAGQSAAMARAEPAAQIVERLWSGASALIAAPATSR